MADLVFVGIIVGFFGLAVLLVLGCERIIGPDEGVVGVQHPAEPEPGGELAA
jgi:hypothetical protein